MCGWCLCTVCLHKEAPHASRLGQLLLPSGGGTGTPHASRLTARNPGKKGEKKGKKPPEAEAQSEEPPRRPKPLWSGHVHNRERLLRVSREGCVDDCQFQSSRTLGVGLVKDTSCQKRTLIQEGHCQPPGWQGVMAGTLGRTCDLRSTRDAGTGSRNDMAKHETAFPCLGACRCGAPRISFSWFTCPTNSATTCLGNEQ